MRFLLLMFLLSVSILVISCWDPIKEPSTQQLHISTFSDSLLLEPFPAICTGLVNDTISLFLSIMDSAGRQTEIDEYENFSCLINDTVVKNSNVAQLITPQVSPDKKYAAMQLVFTKQGVQTIAITGTAPSDSKITNTPLIVFNVGELPNLVSQSISISDTLRKEGATLILTAPSTINNAVASYIWYKDSTQITGAPTQLLTLDSLTTEHNGTYYCEIRNTFGSITTNSLEIKVDTSQADTVVLDTTEQETIFTIIATSSIGGTISPDTLTTLDSGATQVYLFSAETGYILDSVVVDSIKVDSTYSYTFSDIQIDHTIATYFSKTKLLITTSTLSGSGQISPSGIVSVPYGESITFTITPDTDQEVYRVLADDSTCGYPTSYTFTDIKENHTLDVKFIKQPGGMKLIPAKDSTFRMGSDSFPSNHKPHNVILTYDYYMDSTEVTQKEYYTLMAKYYPDYSPYIWDDSYGLGAGDNFPMLFISWYDALLFCNAKSKEDGLDTVYTYSNLEYGAGHNVYNESTVDKCIDLANLVCNFNKSGYRLPTEAEWEYAYRAGSEADFYWGKSYPNAIVSSYPATNADTLEINSYAVWAANSLGKGTNGTDWGPNTVASKLPNAYGLYDMSSNLWEYVNDYFELSTSSTTIDPTGPSTGTRIIARGGCYAQNGYWGTAWARSPIDFDSQYDHTGFRVVRKR